MAPRLSPAKGRAGFGQLSDEQAQEMDDHDLALFALAVHDLGRSAHLNLGRRAKEVSRYSEKAAFYLAWLRHRRGGNLPKLELAHPAGARAPLAATDLVRFRGQSAQHTWLTGYLLGQLRGLDFAAADVPAGTPPRNDRIGHVLRQLGVDAATIAARTDPGAAEFGKLARYTVAERLRKLGAQLVDKELVAVDGRSGRLAWTPATDQFADPAYAFGGAWPRSEERSRFPAAPRPGHLLAFVAPGAPPPMQASVSPAAAQ